MKNLRVTAVHVEAEKGISIGEACRQAIQLCATEWRNVVLTFNDQTYYINCNDLIAAVDSPKTRGA